MLVALLLVLGLAGALHGQLSPCLGAKVGVNLDYIIGRNTPDWSGFGYNFGLELDLHVMPMLGIDIGCSYFTSNYSASLSGVVLGERSINSIYVPVALRYRFGIAYARFGGAAMFQMSSAAKSFDYPWEGFVLHCPVHGTDWYILYGSGLDWKVTPTFSIRPDITFQYNLTVSEWGYGMLFDIGFFYWF